MKAVRAWVLACLPVFAAAAHADAPVAPPSGCPRPGDTVRCRWMEFGAVAPETYLAQHIDMVRVIGTQDQGNLHLFAEFTHLPDGASFLQVRDISGMARAATVSISEADWLDVVSHTEHFLAAEAQYRRDEEREDRKQDENERKTGVRTVTVCGDGLSVVLEIVARGAVSVAAITGCSDTPGDAFAHYVRAKTLALTPGCALLNQEAGGYCLLLAGDVFSAASVANSDVDFFRMPCKKYDGAPSAPDGAFTIDGGQGGGGPLLARWKTLRCGSPEWLAYPSEFFAHDDVVEVTGTIEYTEHVSQCPNAVDREIWRSFRQEWRRDGSREFRMVRWDIGPATSVSTRTYNCR